MEKPSLIHRIARLLWNLVAALVITAAILLALTRVLLPSLDGYRQKIEAVASGALGQPVRIRTLDARLLGLSPVVILEDVRLLGAKGGATVAHFQQARIGVNLLASLRQHRLVMSELTVVGADLTVLRLADGRIRVRGLAGGSGAPSNVEGIGRWLLAQGRLGLLDSRIRWRDLRGHQAVDLERVAVELRNSGERHQLDVTLALPPTLGRSLRLALDLEGDLLEPGGWHGRGYLEGHELRPASWLADLHLLQGTALRRGAFDFHLWGDWQAGQLMGVSGDVAAQGVRVVANGAEIGFQRVAGGLSWQQQADGWTARLRDLRLARNGTAAEPLQWLLRHDAAGWELQASSLPLGDLAAVVPLLPADADGRVALLTALRPQGSVRSLRLLWRSDGPLHLQGNLDRVAVAPWQELPGISGLSGRVVLDGDDGLLQIDSRRVSLALPHLFRAPLALDQLQGAVALHRSGDDWRVEVREARASNADINTVTDAVAVIPAAGEPYLDLRGSFWNGRAGSVPRYLPAHIMANDAVRWLDQAFRGGTVTSGGMLFHGPLPAFPFDHQEGRFEVDFHVADADLFFRSGWPTLTKLDTQVRFLNRGMVIEADNGAMYQSRIKHARVAIDDLDHALLSVQGEAHLTGNDAIRLLRETPLREHLGGYVADLHLDGDSDLALTFGLPLADAVAAEHPLKVDGALTLADNRLQVGDTLTIDHATGQLDFTESGVSAEVLQGRIFDEPATFRIRQEGPPAAASTVIAGQGELAVSALSHAYGLAVLNHFSGRSAWQGALTIPHAGSDQGVKLTLGSDLTGVAIDLPPPLGKGVDEARAATAERYFTGPRQGELEVHYGDAGAAVLVFDGDTLTRGTVRFGAGPVQLPERAALRVVGSLQDVDLSAWRAAFSGAGNGSDGGVAMRLPLEVDMDTLQLASVAVDSGATADGAETPAATGDAWESLPPMQVQVAHFGYGEARLDQLAFRLDKGDGIMQLHDLLLTGPALHLTGEARWQLRPRSHSDVKLQVESPDVGALARQFKVASVITRGKASGSAELMWPGSWSDMELSALSGKVHVRVDDGLMEEVDPGAGRLLGLLSIQALPRRLILDFSDLFQKGLVFNRIEGDTTLRDGNAYTDNLTMRASSAVVHVTGRSGLVARDFDQRITVVPNLSGTAPVVGTLAFGPQVGAVLLLFQKLLKGSVDEAAKIVYHVTGSWDKPVIEKEERPAGEPHADLPSAPL